MLVRKFVAEEWDVTGEMGWKPLWMKGLLDPGGPMGVAHDTFEHICAKTSDADGEFQALGAIVYTRIEGGGMYTFGNGGFMSEQRVVESLVYEVLGSAEDNDQTISDPGRWRKLEDYEHIESVIHQGVNDGVDSWVEDFRKRFDDTEEGIQEADAILTGLGYSDLSEAKRRICGWMIRGFRNVDKYYRKYGRDACEVAYMYDDLRKQVEKIHLEKYDTGAILTVRVDLRRARVSCQVERAYEDDEW